MNRTADFLEKVDLAKKILSELKDEGMYRYEAKAMMNEIFKPRYINGFEVEEGWTMPDPPREGLIPCVDFHGSSGYNLYWWDESWGDYPSFFQAFDKFEKEGIDNTLEDECPILSPDTGGCMWKACYQAFIELGFKG